jgi:hypothetical protein
MPRKSTFEPDSDEALKKLVRQTQKASGVDDPGRGPLRARRRLEDQASGKLGADEFVRRQRAEEKKSK